MKFVQLTIMDDIWNIYLVADSEDVLTDAANAEIDLEVKEIYFRQNKLSIENVRHEIFHLYVDYCFINSANLEQEQMEEVSAELFAYRGPTILIKSDEIYAKLLELKNAG